MTSSLVRWAFGKPRVLLVDGPGTDRLRCTVEHEIDRRGWQLAESPAGTDLLLTLGHHGPELRAAVDVLWSQVPLPRHRAAMTAAPVPEQLDAALAALHAPVRRPDDEPADPASLLRNMRGADDTGHDMTGHGDHGEGDGERPQAHAGHAMSSHAGHDMSAHAGHDMSAHADHDKDGDEDSQAHAGHDTTSHASHDTTSHAGPDMSGHAGHDMSSHAGHAGHDMSSHAGHAGHDMNSHAGHAGHDTSSHAGHNMSSHAGHDMSSHAGHDMSGHAGHDMHHMHGGGMEIAGLPMAETAPDRDGLELDRLAVCLGPWLPGWPTGLVVRGSLQGDVLTDVTVEWADTDVEDHGAAVDAPRQALALDRLARFLLVAGWPTAARQARAARDGLLSASPDAVAHARRAAKLLARRVARSRTLAWSVRGMASGLPRQVHTDPAQDVLTRIRQWCALAAETPEAAEAAEAAPLPAFSVERLAEVLDGLELASARLAVASVEVERVPAPQPAAAAHG
ncbi:hypothetical protein [Georgenia yuyongxinii]